MAFAIIGRNIFGLALDKLSFAVIQYHVSTSMADETFVAMDATVYRQKYSILSCIIRIQLLKLIIVRRYLCFFVS